MYDESNITSGQLVVFPYAEDAFYPIGVVRISSLAYGLAQHGFSRSSMILVSHHGTCPQAAAIACQTRYNSGPCARSSMDRMGASEALGTGSIPVGRTNDYENDFALGLPGGCPSVRDEAFAISRMH